MSSYLYMSVFAIRTTKARLLTPFASVRLGIHRVVNQFAVFETAQYSASGDVCTKFVLLGNLVGETRCTVTTRAYHERFTDWTHWRQYSKVLRSFSSCFEGTAAAYISSIVFVSFDSAYNLGSRLN